MAEFYPFFLVVFAGLFFSMAFRRIHVPWVVALILGGILVGPYGFDLVEITPTIEFIGQIGLIFLMFMAGLETKLSSFKGFQGKLLGLSFINGAVPFGVGVGLALLFGYGWTVALLLGIIFFSSSVAIVIPSLERRGLLHTRLGQSVVMTSVIQDVASLIMLSLVLQNVNPITKLPLYVFYPLLICILAFLRYFLPIVNRFFTRSVKDTKDLFQRRFRATFLILIGTVIAFELLGLHPIIAGFFAGLILSNSIKSSVLREKIRTVSYGIFIPTFFIITGAQTNVRIFWEFKGALLFAIVIILGSVSAKFFSGWVGGRMVGFNSDQALLFGVSSVPQLSTTLAVAFAAFSMGLMDQRLITAIVALSVVTVIASPTLMSFLGKRIKDSLHKEDKEEEDNDEEE